MPALSVPWGACAVTWGRGGMAALTLLPAQHLLTVAFKKRCLLTVLLAGSLCGDTKVLPR